MQNVSIIAQLKKRKQTHDYGTIIIRGYFNRKPAGSRSLSHTVKEKDWDLKKREVKSNVPNASLINMIVQTALTDISGLLMRKEIMGAKINKLLVKKAVQGLDDTKDFLQFCKDRINGIDPGNGKPKILGDYDNPQTRTSYNSECTKLEEYQSIITFADIDYTFLNGYKNHMRDNLDNKPNTIWKSFKFIHTMIKKAIKAGGIIIDNPFDQFDRGKYTEPETEGLELAECDLIKKKVIDNLDHPEMLRKVAIYQLLMSYSGMRFGDAMKFNPEQHIKEGRLKMQYGKAKTWVDFKVHRRLAEIVELAKAHPLKISNKEYNIWSKIIGGIIGSDIKLTAHKGRHTMGNMLVDMDAHPKVAQKILGHKRLQSTQTYFKARKKKVDATIQRFDEIVS